LPSSRASGLKLNLLAETEALNQVLPLFKLTSIFSTPAGAVKIPEITGVIFSVGSLEIEFRLMVGGDGVGIGVGVAWLSELLPEELVDEESPEVGAGVLVAPTGVGVADGCRVGVGVGPTGVGVGVGPTGVGVGVGVGGGGGVGVGVGGGGVGHTPQSAGQVLHVSLCDA